MGLHHEELGFDLTKLFLPSRQTAVFFILLHSVQRLSGGSYAHWLNSYLGTAYNSPSPADSRVSTGPNNTTKKGGRCQEQSKTREEEGYTVHMAPSEHSRYTSDGFVATNENGS